MADIEIDRTGGAATGGVAAPTFERTGFRLSWGAIFAGLVLATAIQIVLTLLGTAIGLSAWDPGESAKGLGIGAAIWAVITPLISLYIGGLVTGRMAGILTRGDGAIHGLVLWGLSTIAALYLLTIGVGSLAGGTLRVASTAATTTASAAQNPRIARQERNAARDIARRADSAIAEVQQNAGEVVAQGKSAAASTAWLSLLGLALAAGAAALGAAQKARE